jgi:hypothetical protein
MARIMTVSEENAQGAQLQAIQRAKNMYGFLPGILRIRLADPELSAPAYQIYQHLNLRPGSPIGKLQREMLATVVNGLIGAQP